MRLKTKLLLAATGLTFMVVLSLSLLFVGELLRQRIDQTAENNEVLAHQVLNQTRLAVETGLRANPPTDRSAEALHAAVADALLSQTALMAEMNAIVSYSAPVQDVAVTDAAGMTLMSTDPDAVNEPAPYRSSLNSVRSGGVLSQLREVFGQPHVLDIALPLDRNGAPFLVVHLGVRSTFLKNSYEPWLRAALWFALAAALAAMLAAGALASVALRPIEQISRQLEQLAIPGGAAPVMQLEAGGEKSDTVVRVTKTIDRLGEQMRSQEAGYSALQTNLTQMLDTLRDGVLLFAADRRAVMVSDAVAHFLPSGAVEDGFDDTVGMVGRRLEEIFAPETALGAAVQEAFDSDETVAAESVLLEDGRRVQISLDQIAGAGGGSMGTLLTLRDTESVMQLEQELEVARRLEAIGRLTAGVGHEVKNPINAMVVHLELLRAKLDGASAESLTGSLSGAQRHVDILAGEMQRLDRVVQTLADFSRPMELHLHEHNMRSVVGAVVELTAAEMAENRVQVTMDAPAEPLMVRVDEEMIRQALLNLLLNAMQAMPRGGSIRVTIRREQQFAVVEVADNGEGIPEELLPRIFELYFTTKPKGSGIGLAMTYRILQLHGGALEVRSNADPTSPEHGTVFTLRTPFLSGETRRVAEPLKVRDSLQVAEVKAGP
jgi:signal transduction histidine kinase